MEAVIEKIIYTGKSLARVNGKVIFTDEGLPGETVTIELLRDRKSYAEAKTLEVLRKSDKRIPPRCAHYKSCSPYQYIDYAYQLAIKEAQLKEALARELRADFGDIAVKPSPRIWGYRNKIRLKVLWKNGSPRLAYRLPDTTDEFAEVDGCFLAPPEMNRLFSSALECMAEKKTDFVDELEIKESFAEKNFLLIFYAASPDLSKLSGVVSKLITDFNVSGAVCLLRDKKLLKETVIFGKNFIEEKIAGKVFRFGAQSFFQVNVEMAEELIKDIKGCLSLTGRETIADLYCGVGTLGIALAENAGKVIGVESQKECIDFLKHNLTANAAGNFEVREGPCEKLAGSILRQKIDAVILDPPRKGIDEATRKNMVKRGPRLAAYVSCNPSTLARDLKILLEKYRLKSVTLYDFFPHTTHIESCAILEK